MMQVLAHIAAFVEAYPAAMSAAAQVIAICIVLCLASCVFRHDHRQPTVNVHIGGGQLDVSVNDRKFSRPLTPAAGGAPGTPQMPMQCSSSAEESSFDPGAVDHRRRSRGEDAKASKVPWCIK